MQQNTLRDHSPSFFFFFFYLGQTQQHRSSQNTYPPSFWGEIKYHNVLEISLHVTDSLKTHSIILFPLRLKLVLWLDLDLNFLLISHNTTSEYLQKSNYICWGGYYFQSRWSLTVISRIFKKLLHQLFTKIHRNLFMGQKTRFWYREHYHMIIYKALYIHFCAQFHLHKFHLY